MRTYAQDLKELNITAEEFDNVISHIYGMTADQAKHEQEKYCELNPEYKTAYNMIYA